MTKQIVKCYMTFIKKKNRCVYKAKWYGMIYTVSVYVNVNLYQKIWKNTQKEIPVGRFRD